MRLPPPPRIPGNPGLEVWTRRLTQRLEQSVRADILWRSGDSPDPRWEFTSTIIAGYSDATTVQVELDCTDGKVYAGAGAVVLDANGVTIKSTATWADSNALVFSSSSDITSCVASIYNASNTEGKLVIASNTTDGGLDFTDVIDASGYLLVRCGAGSSYPANVAVGAYSYNAGKTNSVLSSIEMNADENLTSATWVKTTVASIERFNITSGADPWIKDGSGNTITIKRMAYSGGVSGATIDTTWGSAEATILEELRTGYLAIQAAMVAEGRMAAS